MALIFLDGFDHYTEASDRHLNKWDQESSTANFSINAATGQGGSKSARFTANTYLTKNFSNKHTLYAGFWFSFGSTSTGTAELLGFYNSTTILAGIYYDNGTLYLRGSSNNDRVYASGLNLQSNAGGFYIECKVLFDTFGSLELRVDGEVMATRTNVNTGTVLCNNVRFGPNQTLGTVDMDDFYLLDDSGSTFNNFLGPILIETLTPTGNGNVNDWSVLTGPSNFQDVDENPPDDDTTYVFTNVINEVELYTFTDLATTSGTVSAVQVTVYTRKDSASSRVLNFAARSATTTNSDYGSATLTENYRFRSALIETNPATSIAWTVSGVNGAEFGFKLDS